MDFQSSQSETKHDFFPQNHLPYQDKVKRKVQLVFNVKIGFFQDGILNLHSYSGLAQFRQINILLVLSNDTLFETFL